MEQITKMGRIEKDKYGNISEYDDNNNAIYHRLFNGHEYWCKYDDNNNEIHYRNSSGFEFWREYDNNNIIHHTNSNGFERWYTYDSDGVQIEHSTNPNIIRK